MSQQLTLTPSFNQQVLYDTTPLPESIPKVKEVGASSAPLLSASFFIGARCKDYNDDYMQCKNENPGKGEFDCLKEGRRVTRCARSVIDDINKSCLEQFRSHWACLEDNNHQLWQCRPAEWKLNKCVFENLVGCLLPIISYYVYGVWCMICVQGLLTWSVVETGEGRPRPAAELDACASTEDTDLRTPVDPARRAVRPGEEPSTFILSGKGETGPRRVTTRRVIPWVVCT